MFIFDNPGYGPIYVYSETFAANSIIERFFIYQPFKSEIFLKKFGIGPEKTMIVIYFRWLLFKILIFVKIKNWYQLLPQSILNISQSTFKMNILCKIWTWKGSKCILNTWGLFRKRTFLVISYRIWNPLNIHNFFQMALI